MHHCPTEKLAGVTCRFVDLPRDAGAHLFQLPHIHRILLENVLRTGGGNAGGAKAAILSWLRTRSSDIEIPFLPGRVLMHDTTCGPALVDIAGMRSALAEAGGDPSLLNPVVRVDVSTDHSLGVDYFAQPRAHEQNLAREYERNSERYRFMKWAANTLSQFRVHPPGTGIMHTLNLEKLATVVTTEERDGELWAVPDTMIGTDSHTPMINGIGVLGWGVGGLEAESVMFGMPISLRVPDVVGVHLTGAMQPGVLATDLALTVTERLRELDLQDRFVEFYGPGVSSLTAGDRSVVANMTPEFGGNSGYFPIDGETIKYLKATGRSDEHASFVEAYARRCGIWFDPNNAPIYTNTITVDLSQVTVSLAGPTRPQDRIPAGETKQAIAPMKLQRHASEHVAGEPNDGTVAIAAITSCTNTSDARLVIAAGLLARKARALGLSPPPWVKTSLAPGSPTAERYLRRAGLLDDLEALGFGIVGFGCTTCIGNSGPLTEPISAAMESRSILPVAVLSGNRNFPGRVHPQLEAGFLASPPMVIAFALAGTVELDIMTDPIGSGYDGKPITLGDVWPSSEEVDSALLHAIDVSDFEAAYAVAESSDAWATLEAPEAVIFPWDEQSTYIRRPPFASTNIASRLEPFVATPLMVLGDDITTDHISPAGAISAKSETGKYLVDRNADPLDLNVYASRRGNWEAMVRGLFTNKTVRNRLAADIPPGSTLHAPSKVIMPLWNAAQAYRNADRAVVIIAGERYGMGSSRDWAAKGAALLNVRAILAASFERIHRSNLIGMGVLPLRLPSHISPETLAIEVHDDVHVMLCAERLAPRSMVEVEICRASGDRLKFEAITAIETNAEVEILKHGGILPSILRKFGAGTKDHN